MNERETLEYFLSMPLGYSMRVFEAFMELHNPGTLYSLNTGKRGFMYIPGRRDDRIAIAAHADTVWDVEYVSGTHTQEVKYEDGFYRGSIPGAGIGADDRAGCAMAYLLRDTGHSILITDGEEHGQRGANYLRWAFPQLYDELNNHAYIIQLDRRNASDYKTYNLPVSGEFRSFVEENTGFTDAGKTAKTDIIALCGKICGVNLSVGYYNEHHDDECLCYDEWLNTLEIVRNMTAGNQERFLLES